MDRVKKEEIKNLLAQSKSYTHEDSYPEAMNALEKAHIISQPYGFWHFYVHLKMFLLAWLFRDYKEVFGQLFRLLLALPGSWLGLAPKGNVGTTKMGIFKKN